MTRRLTLARRVLRDDEGWCRGAGWELCLLFEPRDAWVGVFWNSSESGGIIDVYVCLLPFLPLHLCVWRPYAWRP